MPAEHTQTGGSQQKLEERLTAERFVRFDRGFFGGMHERLVRAAVQRAVEKEQAFGREACIRRKGVRNHREGQKKFLPHPLLPTAIASYTRITTAHTTDAHDIMRD